MDRNTIVHDLNAEDLKWPFKLTPDEVMERFHKMYGYPCKRRKRAEK